ncbi:stage III sporulation protein AA [Bacillus sp. AFS055030]|uniref:stage III sporulation protein AA n=1 Tax=Bacillus sp. AFS055030 TaxID=2033507 RepID=UPI000BFD2C58|nr:stage III sporulation protein AA [Bacillus sp. AFS055030]PGL72412.1 stage III sporulation protein AA [Bacillus sp. AFS055030]
MEEVFNVLPTLIKEKLQRSYGDLHQVEELRLRVGRPVEVIANNQSNFIPYILTEEEGGQILGKLSQFSIYTIEEELKKGYITIKGGHRVGLAGRVVTENGMVKMIRDISSYNFRIAKEKVGIASPFVKYVYERRWKNTMLIGPPQAGKTTLLRDFARVVSQGDAIRGIRPLKVGIVDERSEIAGSVKGVPQYTFGERIDVLDACPKAEGMMMLVRSMSPHVILVDEIGKKEDVDAILEAIFAGVQLIVTVHGYSLEEIRKRPSLLPLFQNGTFERFIEISNYPSPGTVTDIKNKDCTSLFHSRAVL